LLDQRQGLAVSQSAACRRSSCGSGLVRTGPRLRGARARECRAPSCPRRTPPAPDVGRGAGPYGAGRGVSGIPSEAELEELLLDELRSVGWAVQHGPDVDPESEHPERDDYREVVLQPRLRAAVARLNPQLDADAVDDVVKTVVRSESQVVM